MIETQDLFEKTENKLKPKDYIILENSYFKRICAPTSDNHAKACILWTKDNTEDSNPAWDKVVSGFKF